jgi:hypothetical protein
MPKPKVVKLDAKQSDPVETLKAKARLAKLKKQLSLVDLNIKTAVDEGAEDQIDGLIAKQKVILSEIEKVEKTQL